MNNDGIIKLTDVLDSKKIGLKLTYQFRNIFTKYMRRRNITQSDLGRKMKKTRANVNMIFNCKHSWNLNTIVAICDALELDIKFEISERLVK